MSTDPLLTLIKVRRFACDEAKRTLVAAVGEENRTRRMLQELERTITRELELASDPASSDAVVEAFGLWHRSARLRLEGVRGTLAQREAETTRSRAELTACRTALESVETLHAERKQEAAMARDQRIERDLADRPALQAAWTDDTGGDAAS